MTASAALHRGPWACNQPLRRASRHQEALPCGSSRARRQQQRPLPLPAAAGPQASAPQQPGAAEQEAAPQAAWSDDMQAEFEEYQREQAAAAEVEAEQAASQAAQQADGQGQQAAGGEQQGPPGGQWTAELEAEFQKYKTEQAAGEPAGLPTF